METAGTDRTTDPRPGRDGRPIVLLHAVDSGVDTLIDLFAAVVEVAARGTDTLIVCETHHLPDGPGPGLRAAHALVRAQLHCRRHGSQLELAGSSRRLRRAIASLGLADVLPEHDPRA